MVFPFKETKPENPMLHFFLYFQWTPQSVFVFGSLSLSFFFRVQTLATVWPPPGGGGHVGKQQAAASEASRLLLGRGGRAKVVVIKSWPWCVLRVSVVLSSSLSLLFFFLLCANIGHRLAAAWRRRPCG